MQHPHLKYNLKCNCPRRAFWLRGENIIAFGEFHWLNA